MSIKIASVALPALAAALAVGACGGSPAGETAVSSHAALTPNQEPNPTTYTITLSTVDVLLAQEIQSYVPRSPASPMWTPDTGFMDWAELAYEVNGGNATSTACILGPAGTGTVLNNCVGGGMANGAFTVGGPLHLTFQTTLPTDTVNVALIMDNLEVYSTAQQNNPNVVLSNDLQAEGNVVSVIGGVAGMANPWLGAAIASVGATLSVAGNVLAIPSPVGFPVTCAGGLLGAVDPPYGTSSDTMNLSFTGDELAQLTETPTGSNTLTFNPSIQWGFYGGGTPGGDPGTGPSACASNLKITLTIARNQSTGVGPSPKSADFAVARTTTENDSFWANAPMQSIDRIYNGGNGLEDIHVGSMLSVAGTPPVAALSNNPNDLQTFWVDGKGNVQGANGTGASPTVTNVVPAGVLQPYSYSPPAYGNLTAAERYPGTYDVAWIGNNGAVYDSSAGGPPVQVTSANEAPPGAPIAMVGRESTYLDLFFIGDDGQLRTSYSRNGGASWSTLVVPGGAVAPAGAHITAASPVSQALDVFYVGNSGALYQASWTPTPVWTNVAITGTGAATPGAPVSVVSRGPTNLDVAFIGSGYNVVWASSTDTTSNWTDGGPLPWTLTTLPKITPAYGSVSIVAGTYNNLDVFFQNIVGEQYTGHWVESTDSWTMSPLFVPPPPYVSSVASDRYWHDGSGNVYHQSGSGAVNLILTASSSGYGASSSLAAFAYPDGGQSVWFLDTLSPPNLRQIYVSPSGAISPSNWGTAPAGCTWSGKPGVSSWGENRADVYENANCGGTLHLFHQPWQLASFAWTDISPPGQEINSAPAVTSQQVGSLDVIVMSANDEIVYGTCYGECTGADFTWYAPSALMKDSGVDVWFGDPALASPSPGVLFAFGVDNFGKINYSQWTTGTLSWTPSAVWYAPSAPCTQEPGGPAVVRTELNNLFVACTSTGGTVSAGWGDTSLQGTWWFLGNGASGAPALTAH